MELEGLRGIAAIMVVLYHFLQGFYAAAIYGIGATNAPVQHAGFEGILYGSPFAGILSGTFAVAMFFVLSGFVLSIGFFMTHRPEIIKKMAIKRYPRLMLPALASVLLCFLLIKLGLSHTAEASQLTNSGWLGSKWQFDASFLGAIKEGVWGIFTSSKQSPYNIVLWTMSLEFIGSIIVFSFALLFARSKWRWLFYIGLLAALSMVTIWLTAFVIGMIFADLYAQRRLAHKNRKKIIVVALLAVGIFLGGYPLGATDGTLYQFLTIPSLDISYRTLYNVLGASVLLYLVLTTKSLARPLRHKRVSALGKYTFSLYLVHLPILFTFTTGLFVVLAGPIGYNQAAIVSLLASVPLIVALTWLFERYVDAPSTRLASSLSRLYDSRAVEIVRERFTQSIDNIKARLQSGKADMEED